MRAMRMTPRQRFLHGFIKYIHDYVMDDLQYEYVLKMEKRKQAAKERRLAKKKKEKEFYDRAGTGTN